MPQGTVLPVIPDQLTKDNCYDDLLAFFKEYTGKEVEIGLVESCEKDGGDSGIKDGEKLIYIIPKEDLPEVVRGYCDSEEQEEANKPTKVKFQYHKLPFKFVYEIKL